MQIESPSYSFVKFDTPDPVNSCCNGDQDFCVPVVEETDTYFQLKITSLDYSEIQGLMGAPLTNFQLLLLAGADNTPETLNANLLRNWTITDALIFERYRTGLFEITLQWRSAFKNIKTLIACGDCFQIAFVNAVSTSHTGEFSDEFSDEMDVDGTAVSLSSIGISNCFKRFCDDCYMTILEYSNEDDYAEFNYCNMTNPVNRVRLPFYLSQPKTIEDKTVYRKSNGSVVQTRSSITKEYLAQTDMLPESIHDKIAIALAHDFTNVISGAYTGGISKNGDYEIAWDTNFNLCVAPASFKATATPFGVRNNNCATCGEVEICVAIVVPDFTLLNADLGEPYSFSVAITGSQPVYISNLVKPGWMSVAFAGPNLRFTGTPDVAGADVEVSMALSNICTDPITISKTINIDTMTAGMIVMWSGSPTAVPAGWALCDGSGGTPNLSGKFIVGFDTDETDYETIGNTGGEESVALVEANNGPHIHTTENDFQGSSSGTVTAFVAGTSTTGVRSLVINSSGTGTPHENRPPYYVLAYIIKL